MDLDAYLDRIAYRGPLAPDLATLTEMMRAHLFAVPYENLDVAAGVPVSRDPAAIEAKIVGRRRGGWCYEMNGMLARALRAAGFDVEERAGGVRRDVAGDGQIGNHLVLLVRLDGATYLVDAGFGDGLRAPVPLAESSFVQDGLAFRLERLDARFWRLHNHPRGSASSFDLSLDPADAPRLDAKCADLQSDPAGKFRANVVAIRHRPDGIVMLRNRTRRWLPLAGGVEERDLESAEEMAATLRSEFDLDPPAPGRLWAIADARWRDARAAGA